jgi:hypothetical protein
LAASSPTDAVAVAVPSRAESANSPRSFFRSSHALDSHNASQSRLAARSILPRLSSATAAEASNSSTPLQLSTLDSTVDSSHVLATPPATESISSRVSLSSSTFPSEVSCSSLVLTLPPSPSPAADVPTLVVAAAPTVRSWLDV